MSFRFKFSPDFSGTSHKVHLPEHWILPLVVLESSLLSLHLVGNTVNLMHTTVFSDLYCYIGQMYYLNATFNKHPVLAQGSPLDVNTGHQNRNIPQEVAFCSYRGHDNIL